MWSDPELAWLTLAIASSGLLLINFRTPKAIKALQRDLELKQAEANSNDRLIKKIIDMEREIAELGQVRQAQGEWCKIELPIERRRLHFEKAFFYEITEGETTQLLSLPSWDYPQESVRLFEIVAAGAPEQCSDANVRASAPLALILIDVDCHRMLLPPLEHTPRVEHAGLCGTGYRQIPGHRWAIFGEHDDQAGRRRRYKWVVETPSHDMS